MNQEPILNAHNKEEYPPMHTAEADTSFEKPSALKQTISWLVKYWWRIPCFLALQALIIVVVMFEFPGGWIETATCFLFYFLTLMEIVLLVLLVIRKRWRQFFL